MTAREEYNKLIETIGKAEDLIILFEVVGRKEEDIIKMLPFLRENHFDCTHLWEDSEEGDKSYDNYVKIGDWVSENIPSDED